MSNAAQTVREIYAAFGRGDMQAILERVDDRVAWESWSHNSAQAAGVPWLRGGVGKSAVSAFFSTVAGFKIDRFEVLDLLASDTQVAVEVEVEAIVPGGALLRDQELHLWTLGTDGKVVRMRHYADTAKHMLAAGRAR